MSCDLQTNFKIMNSNSTLDQPESLRKSMMNRLRKLGIYATVYFSLIFLILSYFIAPEIFDGSLFSILSSDKDLPTYVIYSLISYGATIVALIGAIMLIRKKQNGVYFFLIGDGIWLFLWIMSFSFESINFISFLNTLFALILFIFAIGLLKNSGLNE